MFAYMWSELTARRGANDVIYCLAYFIFEHSKVGVHGAKWSIWWCDGQNKNNYLVWFFQELIRRKVYIRVNLKFFVPGYTTDRNFSLIEKYADRLENVYLPEHWFKHVQDAVGRINSRGNGTN